MHALAFEFASGGACFGFQLALLAFQLALFAFQLALLAFQFALLAFQLALLAFQLALFTFQFASSGGQRIPLAEGQCQIGCDFGEPRRHRFTCPALGSDTVHAPST